MEIVTEGLRFPEGPIAMPDGSVILVEIEAQQLTRVLPDGTKQLVAKTGGGPNGAAMGPDGKIYVCNNGGFEYKDENGFLTPAGIAKDYAGGSIQRVDPDTGEVETLYKDGDFGCILRGPNDIQFDAHGGFWFTDHGKTDYEKRCHDIVGIFYAKADGSHLEEVIFPSNNPNGIGISPDGNTLYAAETFTCRLMKFNITAPEKLPPTQGRAVRAFRSIGLRL
ncbi:SMP-30/gluconolactonase/LRE family protein [Sphingopyxis sp. BSNA05]|uniref:SMP-30/gluconolactonase/LRE family protein n=1 Tax=Sphingopyxis sp. BSNA05 TaxID=1236614 RepID=UPI0020B8D992|nr:SMP-30/gluconolactonase/LRE family protein [Sphingopyxis sp. BSNA05]